ncbi:MAG: hypothetical protein ACFFBL_03855 [Promethearchaeota archaeon]
MIYTAKYEIVTTMAKTETFRGRDCKGKTDRGPRKEAIEERRRYDEGLTE